MILSLAYFAFSLFFSLWLITCAPSPFGVRRELMVVSLVSTPAFLVALGTLTFEIGLARVFEFALGVEGGHLQVNVLQLQPVVSISQWVSQRVEVRLVKWVIMKVMAIVVLVTTHLSLSLRLLVHLE